VSSLTSRKAFVYCILISAISLLGCPGPSSLLPPLCTSLPKMCFHHPPSVTNHRCFAINLRYMNKVLPRWESSLTLCIAFKVKESS